MTLIVLHEDNIYVDSFGTFGGDAHRVAKYRRLDNADGSAFCYWTAAGAPHLAAELARVLQSAPGPLEDLDLSRYHDPDSSTIAVFRLGRGDPTSVKDMEDVRVVFLGDAKPRVLPAPPITSDGLRAVYGSAWAWFMAYYREHDCDVRRAFELTATYHRDVALPLRCF